MFKFLVPFVILVTFDFVRCPRLSVTLKSPLYTFKQKKNFERT